MYTTTGGIIGCVLMIGAFKVNVCMDVLSMYEVMGTLGMCMK